MNVLSNTYIFYVDVYFLQNFLMKIAVICLSLYCNRLLFFKTMKKTIGKIIVASAVGTGMELIGLLVGSSYFVFHIIVHILEIPIMMWMVLGKERQQWIKVTLIGYFFTIVINGVLEILWNWFGEYGNFMFYLGIAFVMVFIGVQIWRYYQKMHKGIFMVELLHNGKEIKDFGFYDSGNRLKEPYTGKGVHIVSERLLQKLIVNAEKKICVPYQSLGNESGLIDVYYIEKIRIYAQSDMIEQHKIPVGVAKEDLFFDKSYNIILNEEVF